MPKGIGYLRKTRKMPKGGKLEGEEKASTKKEKPKYVAPESNSPFAGDDIGNNTTLDFLNSGNLSGEEQNYIFRNVLRVDNPISGKKETYGELFDFFTNPRNKGQVGNYFFKQGKLGNQTDIADYVSRTFNKSRRKFRDISKTVPDKNLIPTEIVGEIMRNNPGFKNPIESADSTTIANTLGFYPEAGEFTPRPRPSEVHRTNPRGFKDGGNMRTKGNFGTFLGNNADILSSVGNTIGNIFQASNLETDVTPQTARFKRSQFKSSQPDIERMNEEGFSTYLQSLKGAGGTDASRASAVANFTKGANEGILGDRQQENRFNQGQDRLQAGVNLANTQTINRQENINLSRRNDRRGAIQNAIQGGTQDFMNVLSNRQVQNMQSKELIIEAMKSGDTGVVEEIARSLGMTLEEFMKTLGDPNQTF